MYVLEVLVTGGWFMLARYEEDLLNDARQACDRACMAEKTNARLRELIPDDHSLGQLAFEPIVYEKFYNPLDDPDENWRDEYKNTDREFGFRWQEIGF